MTQTVINWIIYYALFLADWFFAGALAFISSIIDPLGITGTLPGGVVNCFVTLAAILDVVCPWSISLSCIGVLFATWMGNYLVRAVVGIIRWVTPIVISLLKFW